MMNTRDVEKKIQALHERFSLYLEKELEKRSPEEQKKFVAYNAKKLKFIRDAIELSPQIGNLYDFKKGPKFETKEDELRWINSVSEHARAMYKYNKYAKREIFEIANDFKTNQKTRNEFLENVYYLDSLIRQRARPLINSFYYGYNYNYDYHTVGILYVTSGHADKNFVMSYLPYEKYKEFAENEIIKWSTLSEVNKEIKKYMNNKKKKAQIKGDIKEQKIESIDDLIANAKEATKTKAEKSREKNVEFERVQDIR